MASNSLISLEKLKNIMISLKNEINKKTIQKDSPFEMIEFREFFCGYDRFEMTVILIAKSFLYDKKDDYHSESQQRGPNPLSSFQNENQSSRKESHLYFEERGNPLFRSESQSSFRRDSPSVISKRRASIISKGQGHIISKRQFCQ